MNKALTTLMLSLALAATGCGDDDMNEADDPCPRVKTVEEAITVYGSSWNEKDETKRLCALERSVSPNLVYVDPTVDTTSARALSTAIAQFQTAAPGASIVPISGLDTRPGELRFAWDFRNKDPKTQVEQSVILGVDYVELGEDGRITQIRGFWDPLPTAPPEGTLTDYVAAWTAADASARIAKLATAVSADVRFTAPNNVEARGQTALADLIGKSGVTAVVVDGAQRYPKFARIALTITSGAGTKSATDYVYLDAESRITRIARFEGAIPPI